jgi:hypothetical protein
VISSAKVNPADIAGAAIDEERIRKELRDTLRATSRHQCRVEILMRDVMTWSGNPQNIIRWTQVAREESEQG